MNQGAGFLRAAVLRRFFAREMRLRPERFAALGSGSVLEPPFRVTRPDRVAVGRNVLIRMNAWFSVFPENPDASGPLLTIGDGSRLGSDLVVACSRRVTIGLNVLAADRVFIGDTYHDYRDPDCPISEQRNAPARPVTIGDGAFLGIGSVVLPGVHVGANACVGAAAVVTQDVPPRSVVVGNPARVVKRWDPSTREWVGCAPQSGPFRASGPAS